MRVAITLAILLTTGVASAQLAPVNLRTFQPTPSTLGYWRVDSAQPLGHLSPAFQLVFDYAHRPLVLEAAGNASALVKYQFGMELMAAMGLFKRFELGLALPVVLAQSSGENFGVLMGDPNASVSTAVGDLRLLPKALIYAKNWFRLGFSLPVSLPTGSEDNYSGSKAVSLQPTLLASANWPRVSAGLNLGFRWQSSRQSFAINGQSADGVEIKDQFVIGAGVAVVAVPELLDVVADLTTGIGIQQQDIEEIPVELSLGVRVALPGGFRLQVAGGPGITAAVGTPAFRIFGGVAYALGGPAEEPEPEPTGVVAKAKPDAPAPKPKLTAAGANVDSDGDGIKDGVDKCPNKPEDMDKFKDDDGCPDLDNDGDGIVDHRDKCPLKAEDLDNYQDEDGCPDPDNDSDGVPDKQDRCPNAAEDRDKFQDDDGCVDPDNDGDGIEDEYDKCPNKPETVNGHKDQDGCPDAGKGPVQIKRGRITVPTVYFATDSPRIKFKSFATLEQVAKLLINNTWIKKVRIEGHTDKSGDEAKNQRLSEARATSVMKFLVSRGVKANRLIAKGYGSSKPIADNRTAAGRARNRRVDFVIIDPASAR